MRYLLTILCLHVTCLMHAQLASYDFNSNADDQLNGYNSASVFGTPDYSSGEYVQLDSGEYIVLPNALNAAFDNTKSLEIQVRFKVEGDWEATPALDGHGEEARIILSTKDEYDQRFEGFDITARQWENRLWIIGTYGDGLLDNNGQQSPGKLDFISQIETDTWYDLNIKFIFDDASPYIQYIVNGTSSFSYYDENIDYNGFKEIVDDRQIVLGSTLNNTIGLRIPPNPNLNLFIDSLAFASPVLPGNTTEVNNALLAMIDHMNGVVSYSTAELEALKSTFASNWDDASYDANTSTIHTYMETYSNTQGFVFTQQSVPEVPSDFDPLKSVQFQIQQWILDNKYSASTVGDMGGLSFKEHERYPGTVSASAQRLTGATFTVDGDYQTDPGFYLNDQEYVRRPTGYFVPAGELVTLTVPDAAIGQGLTVYVGANRQNLQETWNEFLRFPRTSTTFELDTKTVTIANPFGGGIYIAIPDGNQLGPLTFKVDGAVKAPYYCTKEGFANSLSEFMSEIQKAEVPYVDMESANFMATITHGMAAQMSDPDSIFSIWDKGFDAINVALGRPQERFRSEYLIQDRQVHTKYTGAPAAYPMSLQVGQYPYETITQQPIDVASGREWYNGPLGQVFNYVVYHEYGHLHNMPTLSNEQETNVHLLATAVYNEIMGESIDSAFVYAQVQRLNLEQATFDWILTPNFWNGVRIGPEPNNPWDQLLYQSRGLVKLVDIVKLFGWEALGEINKYFYDYQIANPSWSPYQLEDDQFIKAASEAVGFNMAPHFEFHGIIPSDALIAELAPMPTSDAIKDRILHYRSLVPEDNDAFQPLFNAVRSKLDPTFHQPRWDSLRVIYDGEYADRIVARIDTILSRYYTLTEADFNDEPTITGLSGPLSTDMNISITLALEDLQVNDRDHEYPNDHTLTILPGENYTFDGLTITPATDFSGILYVQLKVNDGIEDSEIFVAEIDVLSPEATNVEPTISGLFSPLNIPVNTSITLSLDNLIVNDPDHNYPDDHTLIVSEGDNYTLDAFTITPTVDFLGTLSVPVRVSDGIEESEVYTAEIRVGPVLGADSDNSIQFYPNPTDDSIKFKGVPAGSTYSIRDTSGRLHGQGTITNNKVTLASHAGVYFLEVVTVDGRVVKRKVVKK